MTSIRCDAAPGLLEFAEGYLGLPEHPDGRWWHLPSGCVWWGRGDRPGVRVPVVPLTCAAGRDCVVRYLAEQDLDYAWARDIPGALVEGVRRLKAGEEPLLGETGGPMEWVGRTLVWTDGKRAAVFAYVDLNGWFLESPMSHIQGPETGKEGKRLAEAAVRARYWVTP